jgi:hypothetical protein
MALMHEITTRDIVFSWSLSLELVPLLSAMLQRDAAHQSTVSDVTYAEPK